MKAPAAVIVTGATGALGAEVVRHLLSLGTRLAVPYRRAAAWQELLRSTGAPERLVGMQAEIGEPDAARDFVEAAVGALGALDGLALVAGGWAGGARFEQAPADEWDRMRRENVDTVLHVCRAALPHLLRAGGSVVAVGSHAARTDGSGMAAYAVSKSAVHALVRVLALENRDRGVRFNAVLPGTIDTPANRRAMPTADRSSWTKTDAIARTIAFLLSPDSAPVTGSLLPVDGRS